MALKQFSGHTDLNSTRSDRIFREMRLEDNVVRFEPDEWLESVLGLPDGE